MLCYTLVIIIIYWGFPTKTLIPKTENKRKGKPNLILENDS